MRWGERSAKPGALGWVRPLHSIVATFGPETEEPEIVPFSVDGIAAGDETRGHRFMAPQPFKVRRLDDYAAKLESAKVVLDPERRKEIILADAKNLAFAQGYELVEDAGLLAEVAGLVEWPVVLMGSFDQAFLAIPPEVIRTTIRNNQKCFVLRPVRAAGSAPGGGEVAGALANKFILVANIEAADGGDAIVAGNERVIRARLADAKFFYETDLEGPSGRPPGKVQAHRVPREARHPVASVSNASSSLRPSSRRVVGADVEKTKRAAWLCQSRPAHRGGRRISRVAGADGEILRAGAGRGRERRDGDARITTSRSAQRSRADRSGLCCGRARRQDRHAGRILGDEREADGIEGSVCATSRSARGDQINP